MNGTQLDRRPGSIVTFYSYKGGTGRSMALANVAWLLASSGRRVLAIDWDLEAPGLHRYFEPFLTDTSLERSTGVIDFMLDFVTAAVSRPSDRDDVDWHRRYSNLLAHAVPLEWQFPGGGSLDFIPPGRQDVAYGLRVNSFDWQDFYEKLGGGLLLEAVKENLRSTYDLILIDSRTGVSDTSGLCTVQMPDQLVVCFTLNRQSIFGAAAAANSAFRQRHTATGVPTLKIWPVPTRIEGAEKERLDASFAIARTRFSQFLRHLGPEREDEYWRDVGVPYEPYYAYEEVLAVFRDQHRRSGSMLEKMERIAAQIIGVSVSALPVDSRRRPAAASPYGGRSALGSIEDLTLLGEEYERIRKTMKTGDARTALMTQIIDRSQFIAANRDADRVAEELFNRQTAGGRIVGLALALKNPQRRHIEIALSSISQRQSPFEQFHALLLAEQLVDSLDATAATQLVNAVRHEIDVTGTISQSDQSRWQPAQRILKLAPHRASKVEWRRQVVDVSASLGRQTHVRIVDLLRHMLNWAVGREHITSTPFKRGSETLITKFPEDNKRRRRIDEQEEAALLANSPPHIQALIVAAIDTGVRSGEMLALRFADIDLERGLSTLRGETTKSRKTRVVPISTTRLRDVFAWLRRDVEGNPKPLETRVFSNELGEPYRLFHRLWQSIVLKAHGHTPTWNPRLNYQSLSDESQETFRRINLRWHDLRHEYASRLVEHGVPLAQVRDLLGHASITTTERYDNQTLANLQVAAAKPERELTFRAVSADKVVRGAKATAGSESRPYQSEAVPAGRPPKRPRSQPRNGGSFQDSFHDRSHGRARLAAGNRVEAGSRAWCGERSKRAEPETRGEIRETAKAGAVK